MSNSIVDEQAKMIICIQSIYKKLIEEYSDLLEQKYKKFINDFIDYANNCIIKEGVSYNDRNELKRGIDTLQAFYVVPIPYSEKGLGLLLNILTQISVLIIEKCI